MTSINRRMLLWVIFTCITPLVQLKSSEVDLSKSILDFTLQLSRHHSQTDLVGRRSLVWSPLSVYQAMLMAGEGADGKTFAEFERLTYLKSREEYRQWSTGFLHNVKKFLKDNQQLNISLNIANRLYADDEFDLDKDFNKNLEKYYRSQLELVDFNKQEESAQKINQWVSTQTNDVIKEVIKAKDIHPMTRLMLVNALHFKAPWAKPFDADLTTKENFTLSTKKIIELDTMHLTSHFSYYYDTKRQSQWINLPYKGNNRYVLTLALPDKGIQLRTLEEQHLRNSKILSNVFNQLDNSSNSNTRVQLSLPKFRIESTLDLVPHFRKYYKVKLPFDANEADFSLMSSGRQKDLSISKILHKAVIDLDEAGTEAAAVTVVQMLSRSGMFLHQNPVKLAFSRPFLFYLRDMNVKVPLFVGRFTGISI